MKAYLTWLITSSIVMAFSHAAVSQTIGSTLDCGNTTTASQYYAPPKMYPKKKYTFEQAKAQFADDFFKGLNCSPVCEMTGFYDCDKYLISVDELEPAQETPDEWAFAYLELTWGCGQCIRKPEGNEFVFHPSVYEFPCNVSQRYTAKFDPPLCFDTLIYPTEQAVLAGLHADLEQHVTCATDCDLSLHFKCDPTMYAFTKTAPLVLNGGYYCCAWATFDYSCSKCLRQPQDLPLEVNEPIEVLQCKEEGTVTHEFANSPLCYPKAAFPTLQAAKAQLKIDALGLVVCEITCPDPGKLHCEPALIDWLGETFLADTSTYFCFTHVEFKTACGDCKEYEAGEKDEDRPSNNGFQLTEAHPMSRESSSASIHQVFPNPASGTLHALVDVEQAGTPLEFTIRDLAGKVVHTETYRNVPQSRLHVTANVQDLPAGIYMVTIVAGGRQLDMRKLTIAR